MVLSLLRVRPAERPSVYDFLSSEYIEGIRPMLAENPIEGGTAACALFQLAPPFQHDAQRLALANNRKRHDEVDI